VADVAFAAHELPGFCAIDVQPEDLEALAGEDLGEGQTDVAKADDAGGEAPLFYPI
jgi:hypothetical protein